MLNNIKNIVFMVTLKNNNVLKKEYKYSVDSWRLFCERTNSDLFVLDTPIFKHEEIPFNLQRYFIFDLLKKSNIKYNKIIIVDSDTIVTPQCPNIFDLCDDKLYMVHDEGSYDWILRGMEHYSKKLFNGFWFDFTKYGNSGFLVVNKKHKSFFSEFVNFFIENKNVILDMSSKYGIGKDQTILNFLIHKKNIDFELLSYKFNMSSMIKKELLGDDMLHAKLGYVLHFNGLPEKEKSVPFWMEQTYNYLYKG